MTIHKNLCIGLVVFNLILSLPLPLLAGEAHFETIGSQGQRASLTFDRAPLVIMRPTRMSLRLLGDNMPPVMPGKGECDLTMPAMPMPENRPGLHALGNELVGEAIFTMAGEWQASCSVESGSGAREIFVFNLGDVQL